MTKRENRVVGKWPVEKVRELVLGGVRLAIERGEQPVVRHWYPGVERDLAGLGLVAGGDVFVPEPGATREESMVARRRWYGRKRYEKQRAGVEKRVARRDDAGLGIASDAVLARRMRDDINEESRASVERLVGAVRFARLTSRGDSSTSGGNTARTDVASQPDVVSPETIDNIATKVGNRIAIDFTNLRRGS